MDWLRKIVQDPRTERFIMALIIVNAVTLGFETSESAMARFGPLLTVIDRAIIAVFVTLSWWASRSRRRPQASPCSGRFVSCSCCG